MKDILAGIGQALLSEEMEASLRRAYLAPPPGRWIKRSVRDFQV